MKDIIKKLIPLPSPSGDESLLAKLIREEISPFCDSVVTDSMGNIIATKKGKAAKTEPLCICAHLDTSGFVVNYINDDGTLCVHPTGAHIRLSDAYSKVLVNEKTGLLIPKGEDSYYVNIGAFSKEEAEKICSLGDFIAPVPDFCEFPDGRLVSFGLCAKAPCALLLALAREISDTEREINLVFTVQSGISSRGARLVAQSLKGTAIIVDCIEKSGDALCKIGVSDSLCIYSKDTVDSLAEKAPAAERVVSDKAYDVQSFLHAGLSAAALLMQVENIGSSCEIISPDSLNCAKDVLLALCK